MQTYFADIFSYSLNVFDICLHWIQHVQYTVYPKKYVHGFCFAVLCCGYTLTDFPISIRLTSLALWQSNDCPSASKATLMNMDKYFMWIHYERLHNHNKAKHNKTVCIFLGIYCSSSSIGELTKSESHGSQEPASMGKLHNTIHVIRFFLIWFLNDWWLCCQLIRQSVIQMPGYLCKNVLVKVVQSRWGFICVP